MPAVRRGALAALLLLPGALTVYTAFNAGGFFVGTQGWIAVLLALVLLVRVTTAEHPAAGASRLLLVGAGALTLLAIWTLASSAWSDAPARALVEFNRVLLYLLALLLFGTLPMTPARLRLMVQGLALGIVVVCTVGLVTRTLPEVWPITSDVIANERLAYPITYFNTLGLLGALGALLCLHLACSLRDPWPVRVAAAAALPILGATVYLTLSRGAMAVFAIGLLAYLALGRPRGAASGLIASVPATVAAVVAAYGADELIAPDPTTPAAVAQGQDVALVVALCALGAAVMRAVGLLLDARIAARPERRLPRPALAAGWGTAAVVGLGVFLAVGGPDYVSRQYDIFVHRKRPLASGTGDFRSRLTDVSSNGRIELWSAAAGAWESDRLAGGGAGTYQIVWNRERPDDTIVVDAHSLYLEVMAELGAVGLLLLVVALLALLAGALVRIRGPDRALYAVVLAALLTWGVRAGIEWDWEMPVVTLWAFCVGGAVLATPRPRAAEAADEDAEPRRVGHPPRLLRVLLGLGCLLLAITPYRLAQSQGHLDAAVRAFKAGDCREAIDAALRSVEAEGARPEPRLVLTYCDLRLGRTDLALTQAEAAVDRDPDNWQLRYVLAVTRALAGRDPSADLRRARALNPREEIPRVGARRLAGARTPAQWRRHALRAPLPPL